MMESRFINSGIFLGPGAPGRPFMFLLIFLVYHGALSQSIHDSFEIYSTKNGLSQNDVRCLYQDSKGYIWIGTHDGLNRFDGYTFKTYRKELQKPNSINSNLISCIAEDQYGNLWIGTDDEGISKFDRNSGIFTHFKNTYNNPSQITDNHTMCIMVDKNGDVWFGTSNGLNKLSPGYNGDSTQILKMTYDPDRYDGISHNNVMSLHQDNRGNIWVGSLNGLSRYIDNNRNDSPQFMHYDTGPRSPISDIVETDSSLLIVSTFIYKLPFSEINKSNPRFTRISNINCSKILPSKEGNIWCTSHFGVNVLEYKGATAQLKTHFTSHRVNTNSLSKDITTAIIKDYSGIIWIGTNGGGVNLYNPNKKKFRHYRRSKELGSLSYNKIRSILEDSQKNLWIGTEGGGLNYLDHLDSHNYENGFVHYDVTANRNFENYVFSLAELKTEKENFILFGSGYPTIFRIGKTADMARGIFEGIDHGMNPRKSVFAIFKDRDNNIWIGTYSEGIFHYKLDENGMVTESLHFTYDRNNPSGISSNIIRSINQDHKGNIWIGTDSGLNKLVPEEQIKKSPKFIHYIHRDADPHSISHDYILPIFVSRQGQVWIGTMGGGLNKVIKGDLPDNDQFMSYDSRDGLPNNVVKAILEDDDENLWISSNKGLTRFSPATEQITNYGLSDGLQDYEFSELAAYKRSNGELIFGGVNGFNAFYPREIQSDSFNVEVVFGELQVVNKEIGIGELHNNRVILKKDINQTEKIVLNYAENSFSVSFAALHYAAPNQNKYAYMLEGFDKDWIYTTAQNRIAKYTNLSPGDYILKVKASNSDNHWSNREIKLNFIIKPPIWRTNWAIAIYVLLVVVGLWFFRKFTLITNARKNQFLIEHFEKEKIEELSKLKLRFFTNISHEFRTPLTLIVGFIERLKNSKISITETDKRNYYQHIHRNSLVLLRLINQLLDFRKMEQGKMKLQVAEGDLTEYVDALCENFNELAKRQRINFIVEYSQTIRTWFDAEMIERIVFNLLSNAFKFTPEGGEIIVKVEKRKSYVRLEVKDSGIGIPKEIQEHLFERFAQTHRKSGAGSGIGLSFTKSLVEMHHGNITFYSHEKVGTNFIVELPASKGVFSEEEMLDGQPTPLVIEEKTDWLVTTPPKTTAAIQPFDPDEYSLLLVEDNEDILYFLQEHLKDYYNIYPAHDGEEALRICLQKNIDLVISDVMMEGMNGFEFCENLKKDERINHIPIILLTAKDSPEFKIKGYSLGADAYIPKPFRLDELETRLAALIASRRKIISKFKNSIDLSPSEVSLTTIDQKFLKRVMKVIEAHIHSPEFSVELLARECGLSQLHLNKKLKVLIGHTANIFIRSMRLKRAAQLLQKNMYSVAEIMQEVGFNDAKYFRSCFKKEFSMTPSDYQKAHATDMEEEKI
ncbi:two-component regulator propeller domain-containing protein [Fulvivirgaceae bacterium BMA12]|uniref:histidine kinase n=1 Tax=Agaribacillus aureus TaxID=3051825 RepID=A0ABT8L3Z2_9BACT|nr:two-component regulator propeller domain-containing protein [Fulvivirgaceae bacterium BMA12]